MNIYLVRHGESEGNARKFHQLSETPLSKKGRDQAKLLAKRLKGLNIDFIYSSHYERTKETAEIISEEMNKPYHFWKDLREVENQKEMLGLLKENPESKKIKESIKLNYHKPGWKYSNEESFDEVKSRCQKVL